jgi:hypothetical protein
VLQNERVLFHYNGHGVPRPTANGEIWVFNKSFTQYIPMSIYDLQAWVGSPAIYVFDCSAAGLIINSFRAFADQRSQVPFFALRKIGKRRATGHMCQYQCNQSDCDIKRHKLAWRQP